MFRPFFILLALCLSNVAFASCGEPAPAATATPVRIRYDRPLEKLSADVEALLSKRDFDSLDRLAIEYRSPDALTSDGQPKLNGFYAGVVMQMGCIKLRLPDGAWDTHRKLLSDWASHSPKEVAPKLALAMQEYTFGWQARGSGYAHSVTEEGWRLFRARVENARTKLAKLEKDAANDPEWYAAMLRVGLSQSWSPEKFEAMFKRATAKFPYYQAYYVTKANYYSEKWGGSQGAFKRFLDEAVASTQDRMGQAMYARLNWVVKSDDMFDNGRTDWKRMKQGFEDLLKNHNDMWNRNGFARFACMAGDMQTLRAQHQLIRADVMPEAWGGTEMKCRRLALEAMRAENIK